VTSISHVVMVSWKSGKQIRAEELVGPSVRGCVGTIPGVLAVVEGHSTSPEGVEPGHHYGFIVTFATPQARDVYLNDPNHRLGPSGSACKPTGDRHFSGPPRAGV
jgi:hypothetical protein